MPPGGLQPLLAAGDQGPEGLRLQLVLPDPSIVAQQLQLPQIEHVQVRRSAWSQMVALGSPVAQRNWSWGREKDGHGAVVLGRWGWIGGQVHAPSLAFGEDVGCIGLTSMSPVPIPGVAPLFLVSPAVLCPRVG